MNKDTKKPRTGKQAVGYRERIKELRKNAGLTQEKVCEDLGMLQRTYSDYESGRIKLPIDRLIELARYYDVSMDYICGITDRREGFPKD